MGNVSFECRRFAVLLGGRNDWELVERETGRRIVDLSSRYSLMPKQAAAVPRGLNNR